MGAALDYGRQSRWDYIVWRTTEDFVNGAAPSESYLTHDVDLERTESDPFSGLGENNRRNIRKANRAGLNIKFDDSAESLAAFYRLHCRTRKRHGLPPQPLSFFRNIRDHILSNGLGILVTALFQGNLSLRPFFSFRRERDI